MTQAGVDAQYIPLPDYFCRLSSAARGIAQLANAPQKKIPTPRDERKPEGQRCDCVGPLAGSAMHLNIKLFLSIC